MIIEGKDGETHINIYSKGLTELGRWLTNFSHTPIEIDGILFGSVESYFYYLLTNDVSIAPLYGYQAKSRGKEIIKGGEKQIDIELIKKAIDIKLKTYPDKMKELAESSLPLCHYYEYGVGTDKKRIDAGYEWITEHFELRKKQLKQYYGIL